MRGNVKLISEINKLRKKKKEIKSSHNNNKETKGDKQGIATINFRYARCRWPHSKSAEAANPRKAEGRNLNSLVRTLGIRGWVTSNKPLITIFFIKLETLCLTCVRGLVYRIKVPRFFFFFPCFAGVSWNWNFRSPYLPINCQGVIMYFQYRWYCTGIGSNLEIFSCFVTLSMFHCGSKCS